MTIPLKIKVTMSHSELMALYQMMNRLDWLCNDNLSQMAMTEFMLKKHFSFERKLVEKKKKYSFKLNAIDAYFFRMFFRSAWCINEYESNVILRLNNLIDQKTV